MNIMRKMMGHSRLVNEPITASQSQDNALGLMHLRKLFAEFRHPSAGATQKDLEDRLYNMLPLFCKVFGTAPSSDMTEKFGDILQFCSHVSRLMVSEIRRRASNQSTDAASCAIVKFLEIDSTEETSNGWMLLSTINLLSTGSPSLIDCMTAASLPSTLVKCLYLFFDLPAVANEDRIDPESEFTPRERRILLQKVFVQVLVRLCSHVSPAEELARKDDLTLLFSAITSWCPPHNVPWRKSAAEVLMTLSRHGLTPNVVQYIHNKGCVALCIDNMQRVQELSPLEIVEMFVTVFCFLKDSSEVSQILLDDFRTCQGYIFLSEFLLRMELNEAEEAIQALRNLVLLVGSLTTCGYIELKPGTASSGSLFQMPGFSVPQPTGKGVSVRNLQAFQVLQTVFLKAQSSHLCNTILDVISSIYHQDNANYFILEPQCTLSQFAEKIHLKQPDIQIKFFEIIEFLVFNLNYVPCKEFISLSILIKSNLSVECSILCTKSLLKFLHYHSMYKDVFREVGLLEVMVTCLHRYAALMKEPQNGSDPEPIPECQKQLGFLVMDALTQLLSSNSSNAGVFRECGGARCAHNMVPYNECRHQALGIVQQLVLSNGGDDDMGTLLGLMHTAPTMALDLKTHILKSLLSVLRESHRTRTVFRKVGGFVYVMSVLVSMEGCLADPPKAPWDTTKRKDVITLLKTVFSTLTVAMRYEPANACYFTTDVRYASLTEAVRLLGCFSSEVDLLPASENIKPSDDHIFDDFFCSLKEQRMKKEVPQCMQSCCMMLRYLYDMALDAFEKPVITPPSSITDSNSIKRISSVYETSSNQEPVPVMLKRASTGSVVLQMNQPQPDPVIVHAGAIISMLHLVPALVDDNAQLALDLQFHTCEVLKSVMRSEHNQQVMCEAGLPHELLTHCNVALADESHPLHPPLQYIFERLAAQSLTPKDLRDFLRLGSPLCCASEEQDYTSPSTDAVVTGLSVVEPLPTSKAATSENKQLNKGGAVPLTRVKCLVSMTTPRDVRLHGASITPAFVEFDMNAEGFGCLYLPSIAPQGPPNPSVVSAGMIGGTDSTVVGGIGTGERMFPPQAGLTFSTWFCVDKFSTCLADSHAVRLLTIVRSIQGRDENLMCLKVYLSARDHALIVSTQETHMPATGGADFEDEPMLNDTTVRFWCPELTQEGQWCHLVLVFHRAGIMKNSSVSLFVDGNHVKTQKLHYISPNLGGGGTASSAAVTSVFSYIGTPPQLRRLSRLIWRQGPCHLIEDIISSNAVQLTYQLGPNYVGSFQAPFLAESVYSRPAGYNDRGLEFDLFTAIVSIPSSLYSGDLFGEENDISTPIISEEKVIFGLHAHAVSLMTIAKIRKVYNKMDSKSIAKQLGMSAHENATPIRILHNAAGHLSGPARSFGAILMGYLGVRTFCPKPVARMLANVGGTSSLLGLIAMATDVEELYAAVKALVCVVRSNKDAMREMERVKGYQILAMLLKKKSQLLNSHILHLTFSLVGTVDSGRESTVIPNRTAFEDLLCDLEVWREAPGDLQRSLYEHFFELLTESSEQKSNIRLMQEVGLVSKLLYVLRDPRLSKLTMQTIASVLTVLLQGITHTPSLLRFGQFMVSIMPHFTVSDKSVSLDSEEESGSKYCLEDNLTDVAEVNGVLLAHNIRLRNLCLDILSRLLTNNPTANGINQHVCEEVLRILGFDWLMLYMQGHLHSSTVVSTLRVLLVMLSCPSTLQKFREGSQGGGWLDETETVLQNRVGVLLGFNVGLSNGKTSNREINQEICHIPGFTALQWLLPKHAEVAQLYFLLMAVLLGQQVKDLPGNVQFDLDSVWTFIFGVPASQPMNQSGQKSLKTDLCPEAAVVILAMVRSTLNQWQNEDEGCWLRDNPVTLMQFLLFLYHNQPDFVPLCMSESFLCALVSTLFPYRITSESNSELASPVEEFKVMQGMDSMVVINTKPQRSPDKTTPSTLTTHPARKFVMDFLRMILVDSLSLPLPTKTAPVLDLVLESAPEHASRSQRREFQTDILKSLMDHLLAADALLGEQAALPVAAGGSYVNVAQNIFYFANRVVDKLWQGVYTRESKEVFEFISKLISQAKRKASGLSLDIIYKCLNRTVLHQLSRPIFSITDQMNILDTLHKLTSSRSLVFGPGNYDQEFIGCLCYCLLQLTDDPQNITNPPALRTTTWHCDPDADSDSDSDMLSHSSESMHSQEGMQLLANAAKRVWEELYVCKKPTIEELFKVTLNSTDLAVSPKISTPELQSVRSVIQEPAARVWVTYYENEKKCSLTHAEKIQSQLQSKLQKMSSGVFRLASRRTKKDLPLKTSPASVQDNNMWTHTHMSIVKDLVCLHHKQYQQNYQYMQTYLNEEWSQMESELMRERGLWGPTVGSDLDKWLLDMTEGPYRMRKKMLRNEYFYIHYPYRPNKDPNKPTKYKMAMSYDSKKHYERYQGNSQTIEDSSGPLDNLDETDQSLESEESMFSKMIEVPTNTPSLLGLSKKNVSKVTQDPEEDLDSDASGLTEGGTEPDGNQGDKADNEVGQQGSNQTILRLLEEGDKISYMFRSARIQGLDTAEGLLLFGKDHFYVIDGFTLLASKEIADIDSLPADLHDPIIPKASTSGGKPLKKSFSKFAYEDIREVHKRRYLLQPIAIEVFSADGRNFLLAFPRKLRLKIYQRFLAVATAITDNAHQSVSGQKQSAKVEPGTGLISTLIGEKSVTQRWERGEISNFEYLMCLNTLAGRSYNDLMQYPVFPWIAAEYDSEDLDLNDPATFRDLSKPMGAQTPDRLQQFKKRYRDWDDPQGETPPYHYGTHYSSAMIVASYLVRMEPFTQTFLRLQGGHFDLADRMFHSVRECWLSASKHNMADVKELIPEFFYLPEFLLNSNNFDLGAKQSGVALGDVILPAWAKSDPREFIRAHRELLESDYVSAHLNEWIDLIFGHKQQGPAAVDSVNVFHHLFYEGNVDIYSIDDPLKKNATIGFINNFGQIPKQLFKKPHPQKKLNMRLLDPLPMGALVNSSADKLFFHNLDNLKPTMQPIKELKGAVGQIIYSDKTVQAVEQNKVLIPPNFNKYLAWGFSDLSIRIGNYDSEKANMIFENVDNGDILCAACPNAKIIITAGTSTVVNVWEIGRGKERRSLILKQPLCGHTEPVTCLAASSAYNIIVSGSRDRTCIIWDLNRLIFIRQLRGHAAPVAAVCINDVTGVIATCAGTYLYVWTINGDEIASINTATGRNQQILCVAMSQMMEWDIRNVIMTGNSDGVVRMWSVEFVEIKEEMKTKTDEKSQELKITNTADASQNKNEKSNKSNPIRTASIEQVDGESDGDIETEINPLEHARGRLASLTKDTSIPNFPAFVGSQSMSNISTSTLSEAYRMEDASGGEVDRDTGDLITFEDRLTPNPDPDGISDLQVEVDVDTGIDALLEIDSSNQSSSGQKEHKPSTNGGAQCSQSSPDGRTVSQGNSSTPAAQKNTNLKVNVNLAAVKAENSSSPKSPALEFEIVTETDVKSAMKVIDESLQRFKPKRMRRLREGFKWQRQLVFRSKLTMHTAYERKDNRDPAAVTALAVSKDHKTVYVGDAKGRVFSWSVTDQPGRVVADHWVKDDGGDSCVSCSVKFSFSERRHHCRNCGQLFCSKCSRFETEIRRLRIVKPVRVCQQCYNTLRTQQAVDNMSKTANK